MMHLSFTKRITLDSLAFNIEEEFTDIMKPEWFEDPLVLKAIQEVDGNTIYYGKYRWESPVLGVIGAEQLSGGIKTAIAAYFLNDMYFPLAWMGDNLANTLEAFGKVKDIHFSTGGYLMDFNPGHMIYIDEWNDTVDGYYIMDEICDRKDPRILRTQVIY